MRVRALSIHADYACRHSGACCRSGWEIAVERETEERLSAAIERGELTTRTPWSRPVPGLPHRARVVLRVTPAGECVFLERGAPRLCAVHRQLGAPALPSACRQFPRVAVLTPLGVSLTLSHYCPTAAGMLFREDVTLAVVSEPAAFPPAWPHEGLDARGALGPLLRPGVLMGWPSLERFEQHAVELLAGGERSPEQALSLLAQGAEAARRWTPERGAFASFFDRSFSESSLESGPSGTRLDAAPDAPSPLAPEPAAAFRLVADCVPEPHRPAPLPEGLAAAEARFVAAAWPALARPVRHWLAAKAFASWTALQGDGLRTVVLGLRVALGVLRAEAARGCADAGCVLDTGLLKEAVRRADLLLVHLADPGALARRLGRCEKVAAPPA